MHSKLMARLAALSMVTAAVSTLAPGCSSDSNADGGPDASGLVGDALPDAPPNWTTAPNREVRNLHMTWQRDSATTVTFQWATTDTDLSAYVPKVWAVPTSLTEGSGDAVVMPWDESYVHTGAGLIYREALLGIETGTEDFVVWTVEATGLQPDTEYTFRVGTWEGFDPQTGVFTSPDLSAPSTVRTGLPKGERKPFSMVMAGDSRGGTDEIRANVDRLAEIDARLWFFNGDMTNGGAQVEWDDWQDAMAPVLRSRVLMPVQGNHEIFADIYYAQYALPQEQTLPEDLLEHAWSLDFGNVHFVGLDSNTEETVAAQVDWLDADLAAARQDPGIDWIFVMMHHGVYSASNHGSTPRLQEYWVPVFEKYDVDLVFCGHDHDYERTFPLRADQVVEPDEGIVYVVAGGFYSPAYSNGTAWWTATSAHGDLRNYVEVGVDGGTVNVTAWSGDGTEVLDQFTLTR
ncbi:MAG: metallophosphoesterase family protein [Deltaproteobacteria bacterium]|nr:metallophosphoesterase family protein [Deltaproteobacteria bacterium]